VLTAIAAKDNDPAVAYLFIKIRISRFCGVHFNFSHGIDPPREYVIKPTTLERKTARAIGSVTYCSNGFQSVACFRLRKIEIRSI
jgi:hypothetical protein